MGYISLKTPVCKILLAVTAIFAFTSSIPSIEGKLCGKRLSQTLALVCDLYPTLSPVDKRAKDIVQYDNNARVFKDWSNAVEKLEDLSYVGNIQSIPNWMKFLYPKDVKYNKMITDDLNELIPNGLGLRKRGIVEECCHNDCTLEHLIKYYCAKPVN